MIVSYATESYSHYFNYLLSAYRYSNPGREAILYAVNWETDIFDRYVDAFPEYCFRALSLGSGIAQGLVPGSRGDVLRLKPRLIRDAHTELGKPFLWVDADSMVVKDIGEFLATLEDNTIDMMCTVRPQGAAHWYFAAGVLGFCPGDKTAELLKAYVKACDESPGIKDWFHDQLSLFEVCETHRPNIYRFTDAQRSLTGNEEATILCRRPCFELAAMLAFLRKTGVRLALPARENWREA